MKYSVSGNTWPRRELLQSWRGKWDNTTKSWVVDLSTEQFNQLKKTVGLVIVPYVEPVEPERAPVDWDWLSSFLADDDDQPDKPRIGTGRTGVYGDDERFLNCFKDTNPTAFFGFSSLRAFVDYIEALDSPRGSSRDVGWETSTRSTKWTGTPSMAAAIRLARDGWHEGAKGADALEIPHATARKRFHSVAGGTVSVGRMLAGNPAHMVRRPKQPGRKVTTLFVETFMSSGIDPANAIKRAILIAGIADTLDREGYSCEIVAIVTTSAGSRIGHQAAITLKQAGERLNLLDVVFALGHPSFFRRLIFAAVGAARECESTWRSQGSPSTAFDAMHMCKKNEFYIKQLSMGDQSKLDKSDPFSMLKFIEPDGLPITLRDGR